MKSNKAKILVGILILLLITMVPVLFLFDRNGHEQYDIVYFGDSIIAGNHSDAEIPELVAGLTGMKTLNAAFGGTALTDTNFEHYATSESLFFSMLGLSEAIRNNDFSLVYTAAKKTTDYEIDYWESVAWKLTEVDWKSVRYIIIEHGVNDYLAGVSLEDYSQAISTIIDNIHAGAPQATIVFTTPIYCFPRGHKADCNSTDFGGGLLYEYANAQKLTALANGAYSIDNYNEININADNYEEYLEDGLHPNDAGKKIISENVGRYIKEYEEY